MDYRILSIGALSAHELWGEKSPARHAHATTTLVRSDGQVIVVDPGLPAPAMAAVFKERSGLDPAAVTHVFLTNFRPAHRRGIDAFPRAQLLISEMEREAVGKLLLSQYESESEETGRDILRKEIELLRRCEAAADRLAEQVDLFPLPGFTPGTCGLLLLQTNSTTLVASDAVATVEHLESGRVLRNSYDAQQARESLVEALEIADVIIPGHDNIVINPTRRAV